MSVPESVSGCLPAPTTGSVTERIVLEEPTPQRQSSQKRVKFVEPPPTQQEPQSIPTNHGESSTVPNSRPGICQWLRLYWLDNLTTAALGALALLIYLKVPPVMSADRLFSVHNVNGTLTNSELAYPWRHERIPIWISGLLSVLVPVLVYLLMALRIRSFWDLNNAIIGTSHATLGATVFQLIVKMLVGGFRPHFLDLCKPNIPQNGTSVGDGFGSIYYDISVCKGWPQGRYGYLEALESFPSGHTTAAFASSVFLSLYLNAKLKLLANYQPSLWKLILVLIPLLNATIQGGVLTIEGSHHWYDILAGAAIGTLFAFSAFRMMYAALFDFRFNHIPLLRNHGFLYHARDDYYASNCDTVFTHAAGWATKGMFYLSGAPSDVRAYQGDLNGSLPNTHPNTTAEATNKTPGGNLNVKLDDAINDSSSNEKLVGTANTSSQADGQQMPSKYSQDLEPGAPRKPSKSCQKLRTPASNKYSHRGSGAGYSTSPFRFGRRLPDVESGLHLALVNLPHPNDRFEVTS